MIDLKKNPRISANLPAELWFAPLEHTGLHQMNMAAHIDTNTNLDVSAAIARHAFLFRIDELSDNLFAVPLRCSINSSTLLAS